MIWLYDLFFAIFMILALPVYLLRRKLHRGLLMRLGIFPKEIREGLKGEGHIWIHAVSVGEVNAVFNLVNKFHEESPGQAIVISTVTPTGNRLARSLSGKNDLVIYLPFDLSFITDRFVRRIKPSLFITTETELWPNLITSLRKNKVPIFLVNGRISLGSFRGYRLAKFFLKNIFASIKLFCMQSEGDAKRIIVLGASSEAVRITGNMKFDMEAAPANPPGAGEDFALKLKSVLMPTEQLLLAGSTHSGEEEIILKVYQRLLRQFTHLKLLLAPRHVERAGEIEKICQNFDFNGVRLSGPAESLKGEDKVFILDSIGQLKRLYSLAAIVFVGGSLVKKGGHNIIEPAFFGKPIIVGHYMFNFKDITRAFLNDNGVIMVSDETEFMEELRLLLLSSTKRDSLGQRALGVISKNKGATIETFKLIKPRLGK